MDNDLKLSIQRLTDGFTTLSEAYKCLAQQHESLSCSLASFNTNSVVPNINTSAISSLVPSKVQTESYAPSRHNLSEWLENKLDSQDKTSLAIIRDAEFACFKLKDKLASDRMPPRSHAASSRTSRRLPKRFAMAELDTPMEQDMTVPKTPGQLGCPFAPVGASKPAVCQSSVNLAHNLPTPRGSGSKRPSFADPIRPDLKARDLLSPAMSITEDTGPACPIRFMGQHTPEDMAKYFEEHKHELPRSHEICVKRFQANAVSIKELDAKYGNLVTMIQGLGEKHQAMLPDTPNAEEIAEVEDDRETNRRVKNWAKAVSECAADDEDTRGASHHATLDHEVEDDDRQSRFDRPLQEIRLGESPSRPWGVRVPPTYGAREANSVTSSSPVPAAAAVSSPEPVKKLAAAEPHPGEANSKPTQTSDNDAAQSKPTAKCPFDHAAMRTPQPTAKATPLEPPTATPPKLMPQTTPLTAPEPSTPRHTNYGLAIVANAASLPHSGFDNRGTLILGYDEESVRRLFPALG